MSKFDANPQNGTDRGSQGDSDILVADDGGEILTDGNEQDDEPHQLDNPAWKNRLRTDGGVEIDKPYTLTTLKCRIRGRSMFGGDDDGVE